jgi:hypothetical protein
MILIFNSCGRNYLKKNSLFHSDVSSYDKTVVIITVFLLEEDVKKIGNGVLSFACRILNISLCNLLNVLLIYL